MGHRDNPIRIQCLVLAASFVICSVSLFSSFVHRSFVLLPAERVMVLLHLWIIVMSIPTPTITKARHCHQQEGSR